MWTFSHILFYFFGLVNGSIIGMMVAGISGAAEGQGLAAGGIVVGYGLMAGLVLCLLSVGCAPLLGRKWVRWLNRIHGILLAIFIIFFLFRIWQLQEKG